MSNATNNITVLISSGDSPEAASRQASDPDPSVRPSICPACPAFRRARVVSRSGVVEAAAPSLRGTTQSLHRRDPAPRPLHVDTTWSGTCHQPTVFAEHTARRPQRRVINRVTSDDLIYATVLSTHRPPTAAAAACCTTSERLQPL